MSKLGKFLYKKLLGRTACRRRDRKGGGVMRLIDADALTEFFKARMALWLNVDEVLDVISDAPTISVEHDAGEPFKVDSDGYWYCRLCGEKVKWDD